MSKYSVKIKELTWKIGHLSVHYKKVKGTFKRVEVHMKGNDKEIYNDVKGGEDVW